MSWMTIDHSKRMARAECYHDRSLHSVGHVVVYKGSCVYQRVAVVCNALHEFVQMLHSTQLLHTVQLTDSGSPVLLAYTADLNHEHYLNYVVEPQCPMHTSTQQTTLRSANHQPAHCEQPTTTVASHRPSRPLPSPSHHRTSSSAEERRPDSPERSLPLVQACYRRRCPVCPCPFP